jgi:hypothetical protein
MTDFKDLDPEIRCFALVGQFLQAWSFMEDSLHKAIGTALSIETPKLQILCANIRFRDKIHILSTLIDVAPIFSNEAKAEFKKALRELAEYSGTRNMIAHDGFRPNDEGVEFLTVKAKGKFDLPKIIWNADRFQSEGAIVAQYRSLLDGLQAHFQAQPLAQRAYAGALLDALQYADTPLPMRHTMSPALLYYLSHQPQDPPDNDQANQEKSVQTPDRPLEK